MTTWLEPVAGALGRRRTACPFFFRDDDAGWADDSLWALLDEFAAFDVTVDVAAIPTAVGRRGARELRARVADGVARVHQHGWSHANHEPTGRKCEFGPARSAADQSADVAAGRARLEDLFGAIDPVFTPPWNRCSAATGEAVLAAGHRVLSRDESAGTLCRPGLTEVAVTVDWCASEDGVRASPDVLGRRLAAVVAAGGPVGVMLHHAVMDASERAAALRPFLALVVRSPVAVPTTITALASSHVRSSPAGPRRD